MQKIVVKENQAKERIDKFLTEITSESRTTIGKMLSDGFILVNNTSVKSSYILKENDEIIINDNFKEELDIKPVEMDLNIVYEDEDLIVVDKQSGLTVHPGSGNIDNTLVNGLMYHTKDLSDLNGKVRPGIVHRIDKDTSGLLLVAKTNKAHRLLAEGFKNKTIKREYIALLCGSFPHETATIDAPIGRSEINRKKMTVTSKNSKEAITHLKVLQRYTDYTEVLLQLETGRTHQIRVHMEYIGYPIYNDPVYNTKPADPFGQFLHSATLEFKHPITGENLSFKSNLPEEFAKFLETLV